MGRRRPCARLLVCAALAAAVLLGAGAPAAAGTPRPTADPSAPTPTAPVPGGPPQGSAPDGSTVGGDRLATRGVVVAAGTPPLPAGLAAAGWLVADAGTGDVLAARDPHGRYYPASTLKTLTLLTLQPLLDPHRVVVGTRADENIEGSKVGLVAGGRYPVSLLFQALVLQSGNDAANALARAAGGVDVTVRAMGETAASIGAYDTVVGTPSGLDVAGQSSSPYDLALIFRALLARPAAAAVLRLPTARMPGVPGRTVGWQIQSQNPLLTSYPGDLGGKTGFTDAARHTFVTAAERNGRRLVVSVMDTERRPLRASDQAARLLDWGFSVPPGTPGVGVLVSWAALPTRAPAPIVHRHPAARVAATARSHDTAVLVPVGLAAIAALIAGAAATASRRRPARSPRPAAPPRPAAATGAGARADRPPQDRVDQGSPSPGAPTPP
ncbi:MAG TPA: serine hydrolase [Blastococcus sp.]|jgi:D-alanyl-D-alanine carboxypeptidase (penicillin-binding protein 5/6)|nr:serine hydrolase [Blastococcus sp.]